MKRKHWTAIAFLLAITPLGVTGLNGFKLLQNPGYTRAAANPPLRSVKIPTPGDVREIVKLTSEIRALNAGLASDETQVDLTLFGYEPSEDNNTSDALHDPTQEENNAHSQLAYAVTLTFASETKRFCVIDGKFYPEGGILPDGARILAIEAQQVLIHKFNLKRWIPVTKSVGVKLSQKR